MPLDLAFVGRSPEDLLAFLTEILQSSTQYSLIGEDLDGKIVLWNEGARRLYGYTAAEVLGKARAGILHPPEDVAAGVPALVLQGALRDGSWEGLLARIRKNGERFLARAVVTPHYDASGRHVGYLLISSDVTREAPAVESVEKFHSLLEAAPDAMMIADPQGRIAVVNAQTEKLFGFSRAELIGRPVEFLVPERFRHGHMAHRTRYSAQPRARALGDGGTQFGLCKGGREFPAEISLSPLDVAGQSYVIATVRDATRSRSASLQRLREVLASSPAVLGRLTVVEDRIEAVSWISDNVREIFGYAPEATLGSEWWRTNIDPSDHERIWSQVRADLRTRGYTIQEFRFRHATGHYCWTRCEIRLIRGESGEPSEAVAAWSDITASKAAEMEQAQLREQFHQVQKLESVGRLAGGVAHDFNNLLTVINGYADMLLKEADPDDPVRESVAEIRQAGQRAAELVGQLLLLSRNQIRQPREVNLNEIVVEVGKLLNRVIREDIRVELVLSPSLGNVLADPGQLHQVLMNLAINARDAMPSAGALLIETSNVELADDYVDQHAEVKAGSYVQLMVSDTGTGMTKDVLEHLFEPFFTTKRAGEGTGLGLATVYGIVKQSGGSIWVYSEPGVGTTFKIYFPRIYSEAKTVVESVAPPLSLSGSETILVVEDQSQLRKMAVSVLRSHGYQVLEAADGEDALLRVESHEGPIHLLLTDVVMPGMSGRELADRLKPLYPEMETIYMSGYSERAGLDRQMLESAGAYLAKPFSPEALAVKVRELLGSPRGARTILVADDEPGMRRFLRKVLEGAGYQVLEAKDGKEAVRQIEASTVDLLITDLAMPEQEGVETIMGVRRTNPLLKIIAMSGVFPTALLKAVSRLGAHATLIKPIQADELLETVARLMGG